MPDKHKILGFLLVMVMAAMGFLALAHALDQKHVRVEENHCQRVNFA